ncbi:hypothetical protein LOTGIDRAFT_156763 [Lottia gigantea]|uniref:RNA polymerase II-associated protein 1 C-terminal domain-containing protein n=1 Tax=Lottia gigantea TaxID=225164 RepID=V4BA67_LOTGI|nr:hypothetical protein LOTGIDRAFT_156763 [Lottia gigantea]ESP02817.1 hypothetical protein LOTGIDRAFT_156763 [Lottia gigantea]
MSLRTNRPGRGESEDDLLKFQEEFLKSKKSDEQSVPSAACVYNAEGNESVLKGKRKSEPVNTNKESSDELTNDSTRSKLRTFETTKPKSKYKNESQPLYEVPVKGDQDLLNEKGAPLSTFLTQIVERDTRNINVGLPQQSVNPFPTVSKRDTSFKKDVSSKKRSIFAQQLQKNTDKLDIEMKDVNRPRKKTGFQPSQIIKGSGLSVSFAEKEQKQIHEENAAKLAEMTEADILEEQKKLMGSLDPKMLSFLRKKPKEPESQVLQENLNEKHKVSFDTPKEKKFNQDDLPIKTEEDWVGMDDIEYDKLEWMKELPPIKTDSGLGKQARFDLNGDFIPADKDIPLNQGLHHHGDEPQRAGYTLEELFHLSRSSNIPQRCLVLNVLAKIILRAKQGLYADNIQTSILPTVLQAGVVFLFRWALDDSSESVQMAAINTLYSLLCCPHDEVAMETVCCWYQGLIQPCLPGVDQEIDDSDEEKPQESDDEMARRDLVLALINRMMILPRLKYLLMEKRLSAPSLVQILQIFTRLSQHSQSAAYQILHCPGLMKYIFSEFLPTTWTPIEDEVQIKIVRGYPVPEALKLIVSLCKNGKNMAAILISTYNLQDIIQRYIAIPPKDLQLPETLSYNLQKQCYMLYFRDLQLPETISYNLQKQCYIIWKVCLSYGLMDELYLNMYSVIVEKIRIIHQNIINNKYNNYMVISTLESVLHVASITLPHSKFISQEEVMEVEEEESGINEPMINWSNITGLYQPIIQCLQHTLQYIGNHYQFQREDLSMITCLTNYIAGYYEKIKHQVGYNAVETLQTIERLSSDVLIPFWKSLGFHSILSNISQYSNLLSDSIKHDERTESLPDCGGGCLTNNTTLPILQSTSPFGFLTSYLRLVLICCKLHKGMIDQMIPMIVNNEDMISYMRNICQVKTSTLLLNYFTRFENIFQYQLIKLSSLKECNEMKVYHHVSLQLLIRLQYGDEYIIHDLLSFIVFSSQYLSEYRTTDESLQSMADLQLTDVKKLKSATQEEVTLVTKQLIETARNNLLSGSIRNVYLTLFSGKEKVSAKSRARFGNNPTQIDNLVTNKIDNILPQDWMFLPLVELYNQSSLKGSHFQDHMPVENIRMVSTVLQWIYLLECERLEILRSITISIKLSRIMCVFLAGNDLFLERCIRSYLAALLREYSKPVLLQQIDFTLAIPGLLSFYDLYQSLLEQYGAVSFGDSVFCSYILIPLQQHHSINYRQSLWSEHLDALRAVIISTDELLLPIERFLEPDESDISLIQIYWVQLTQLIQPVRNPLLYLIAVHHINRFLYYTQDHQHQTFRHTLWSWVKGLKSESLKKAVIFYKKYNQDCEYSMEIYTDLPSNRQLVYNEYINN